jgi:O-antigen ligase
MKGLSNYEEPMRVLRYAYFAFLFSLPFQASEIGTGTGIGTLSRLLGFSVVMVGLLQPSLCFRHPPKAFWYFAGYLYILGLMIFWHGFGGQAPAVERLFSLFQMLVLFWISYNLMQDEDICTQALMVLATSCTILAAMLIVHVIGVASEEASSMTTSTGAVVSEVRHGRLTAFGANPNGIATTLSTGLLAFIGLVFGPGKRNVGTRLLAWPCMGILAIAIVRTGTRGAVVAILVGLIVFLLSGKGVSPRLKAWVKRSRLKIGLAAVGVIGLIVVFSYQYEPIRARWEQTLMEGRTAGREKIYSEAFGMFLEKPWLGWGPATFVFELGSRLGIPVRDPHNVYLWILLETGIVGAVPFFAGLWLCWRSAWKARGGSIHSIVAAGLIAAALVTSLKGTNHKGKMFWIVLAYALASGSVAALPRPRRAVNSPGRIVAQVGERRKKPRFISPGPRLSSKSPSS